MKTHECPICNTALKYFERYPNYICPKCAAKASDKSGRLLSFGNEGMWGGFEGVYMDNGEEYNSHACYVDKIECNADEARFGGIVIEVGNWEEKLEKERKRDFE